MKCINCLKEFNSKRKTAKYCSDKCRIAYNRNGVSVTDSVTETPLSVTEVSVTSGVSVTSPKERVSVTSEVSKLSDKIRDKIDKNGLLSPKGLTEDEILLFIRANRADKEEIQE